MAQQQAAVCTQLHPPTAVTHCNAAWLTRCLPSAASVGGGADNSPLPDLVVVRSTQLELFSLHCSTASTQHLQLVFSCQLFGIVESVAVLRGRAPGQRDALLLTFRDAKLSVLHWDPALHDLTPSSLHYFEGDASLKQGRTVFPYPPLALTDPLGRCGAVLMFRHQLAVLPALDSDDLGLGLSAPEEDEEAAAAAALGLTSPLAAAAAAPAAAAAAAGAASNSSRAAAAAAPSAAAAVGNSYVDNLGKAGIKEVRDACFLHGYSEPVLALLHEGEPTWAGNLRQKKDTCVLTALSLNLTRKHHPKIWGAQQLPSDAYRLSAAPCGGVLVLCQHLVLHYKQGQQTGVVLHPSALLPSTPPPPLTFDPGVMAEAGGPGPAAAEYARQHAMDVHPEAVPAAVAFCDTSRAAELKVTADCASVCWLAADTALLCLRSGQLLQLALLPQQAGGSARRLDVARAGAAPQPSCCCSLPGPGLGPSSTAQTEPQPAMLFLGSAAGDSLLVRATPSASASGGVKRAAGAEAGAAAAAASEDEPASKRFRLESVETGNPDAAAHAAAAAKACADAAADAEAAAAAAAAAAVASDSEDEEALIYGTALMAAVGTAPAAVVAAPQLRRYQMKVLDSLANIGPVRDFAVADSVGGPTDSAPAALVACSGEGKGGTLTVLRRSIVPDVITEVPLPGLLGAWAVQHRQQAAAATEEVAAVPEVHDTDVQYHSYLLLTFQGSTKVLATGDELREVTDNVEFAVDTPTLAAGSLCGGRRIAQAFPLGLRLLDGEESVQDVWASELAPPPPPGAPPGSGGGATIVAADICDPFVLLLLSDGSAVLLTADPPTSRLCVDAVGPDLAALRPTNAGDRITACSLFADSCGWLASQQPRQQQQQQQQQPGDRRAGLAYALLCRASGACQLYALPAWQLVFASSDGLAAGAALLLPAPREGGSCGGPAAAGTADEAEAAAEVVEARLVSFGAVAAGRRDPAAAKANTSPACEAPVLLALTADHQLLSYKAFFAPPAGGSTGGSSSSGVGGSLRFRRQRLDLPPLLPPAPGAEQLRLRRLHCFEGLGEDAPYSGVFVSGQHPHWLVASRGRLLPHPHHLPPGGAASGVGGFTPFHNINCPHGFIVASSGTSSGIQISQLPPRTRIDAPWPRQRVPIKGTPLKIAHYAEAGLFAVLSSRQVPSRPFLPEEDEPGEPAASYSYALAEAAAKARGTMEGHEVRLVWPGGGWQGVWRHQLLAGERALSVAAVRLKDQSTGATVPLLAVGAALPAGEDYPCGGRLLLFEVTRADGGQWAGRHIYTREFRGPVTALAGLEGYLLLASGNRIETCSLSSTTVTSTAEDGTVAADTTWKLQRSAFFDGPMLLTSLNVVKNFVLLGDCQHSVQFVRYKDEGRQLSLLSKDFNRADTAATQFLINGSSLHLASADSAGTLRLLSYAPSHPGSWKGQKLVAWGSFHIGDPASAMQRIRLQPPSPGDRTTRQAVLLSSAAGSLQLLAPLALPADSSLDMPAALAALRALQRELLLLLPQAAGLNPGAFRRRYAAIPPGMQGGRCFSRPLALDEQGVLDGDLLQQFLTLPRAQQDGAAEASGLERQQLIHLLQGLWRASLLL